MSSDKHIVLNQPARDKNRKVEYLPVKHHYNQKSVVQNKYHPKAVNSISTDPSATFITTYIFSTDLLSSWSQDIYASGLNPNPPYYPSLPNQIPPTHAFSCVKKMHQVHLVKQRHHHHYHQHHLELLLVYPAVD